MTKDILDIITIVQRKYIQGESKRNVFTYLLDNILKITKSEYGFIGEVLYDDKNMPFLRTYAITNIAWTDELKEMYKQREECGWDFTALNNLFGLVITENKVIISNDPNNDERRGGLSKIPEGHPPLERFAGIPFYHESKIIGMVGIANKRGGYTEQYIKTIQPFIDTCSTLITGFRIQDKYKQIEDKSNHYISRLSHELRTPLNAIFGYCQLIEFENNNKTINEYNNVIRDSANVLLNLIDDVLLVSRDTIKMNIKPLSLPKILDEEIEMVKPLCRTNNITIITEHIDNIEIMADDKMIRAVFLNLLSNAIKYNKCDGQIFIKTKMELDLVKISIKDTGIGIKDEEIREICEPFFRALDVQHIEGNGLGLSIVKKNIVKMNGSLDVMSIYGQGSKFIVSIPYNKPDKNSKDVIYVEDNQVNQKLVETILKKSNYSMDMCEFVKCGVHHMKNNNYLVYILDLTLPDGDIHDMLPHIPDRNRIIVLTADANTATKQEIYSLGIKHFITKPFNLNDFLNTVHSISQL